jgi:hypothetical protein
MAARERRELTAWLVAHNSRGRMLARGYAILDVPLAGCRELLSERAPSLSRACAICICGDAPSTSNNCSSHRRICLGAGRSPDLTR